MVKFLKRSVAVFLSCAMLFCNISECFGVGGADDSNGRRSEESLLKPLLSVCDDSFSADPRQPEVEPNPVSVEAGSTTEIRARMVKKEDSTVDESSEQISRDPVASSTTGPTYPSKPYGKDEVIVLLPEGDEEAATRAYAAKRIHAADVGRSIDDGDHSKVTVPTQNFFLYPSQSVKELFELKDRAEAIAYRDSEIHSSVVRNVNGSGKCNRIGILIGKGLIYYFLLIGSLVLFYSVYDLWVDQAWSAKCNRRFEDDSISYAAYQRCWYSDPVLSELTIGDIFEINKYSLAKYITVLLGEIFVVCLAFSKAYQLTAKACCDCYLCKPSDVGCNCCYGCGKFPDGCNCCCGSNKNGCTRCVNCCACGEDNCCLKCCPCDNGGFGCDWCGRYGIGTCCGKMYQEFSNGEIKTVSYFEKFLRELHCGFESDMLDPYNSAITYFRDILRSPSLTFKKMCEMYSMKPDKAIGLNQADGCLMIPARAYAILGGFGSDKYPPPAGVQDYNVWLDFIHDGGEANQDPFGFEHMEVGCLDLEGFIDYLYDKMYDRDVDTVLPEFQFRVLSDKDVVGKFIFVTLALCRYALGNTGELDDFARVRLRNYFNFLLALWKVRGFERK